MIDEFEFVPYAFEPSDVAPIHGSCPRARTRRRSPVTFSAAEAELRRVHAIESARGFAALARLRARALPFGGAASLWRDPPAAIVLAEIQDELRLARRDAAAREPLLQCCVTLPRGAWPSARALARAAFERRGGVDERLTRALARFARTGRPGPEPLRVLLTCSRGRPRALAFALLGFGDLARGDAAGARAHFEAAWRARPTDARLAWLARAVASDVHTGRADGGCARLASAFTAAREHGLRALTDVGRPSTPPSTLTSTPTDTGAEPTPGPAPRMRDASGVERLEPRP